MSDTFITVTGNVCTDPVRRVTRAGTPFLTFRLASNARRMGPDGIFVDDGTSYYNVSAFRTLAVNADVSVHKGQPVVVHGKQRIRQWESGGRVGTSVEIDARTIGHDLSFGQSDFSKSRGTAFIATEDPEVVRARIELATGLEVDPATGEVVGEAASELVGQAHDHGLVGAVGHLDDLMEVDFDEGDELDEALEDLVEADADDSVGLGVGR